MYSFKADTLSTIKLFGSKYDADHISIQINMVQYLKYFVVRL